MGEDRKRNFEDEEKKKMRIMLTVAYDGTHYHGWQYQPDTATIEGELNQALSQLCQSEIKVIGASRTDTGVHALGNLAVFDTKIKIPPAKIAYALNAMLPPDIRIQKSEQVEEGFHPRKTETKKTYCYKITNREFANPLERLYSYFTYVPLNIEKMQEAALFFKGEHDFKAFCATGSTVESTVRKIHELTVTKKKDMITIEVTGNGFLYNMVRIIAGTLMEVGRGKILPEEIENIIDSGERKKAGPTAPACGLTLMKYEFEKKIPSLNNWKE